jgi:4-coumarate--CoA ligase (photoactive yellow protein activation family)
MRVQALLIANEDKGLRWWRHEVLLQRYVADIVDAELMLMRRGRATLPAPPWPVSLHLTRDLGVDSLERHGLATTLATALHMDHAGLDQQLLTLPTLADWVACARRSLALSDQRYTFHTSGSLGLPKLCTHRAPLLCQEVHFLASLIPQPKRILYAVPAHHIYGFLFTLLLPLALQASRVLLADVRAMLPARLPELAEEGDLVIAYPEFWAACAASMRRFPSGVSGVTSTAPCADHVAWQLETAGLASLLQVYGSSETAGVGWRSAAASPYTLFPYWRAGQEQDDLIRTLPGSGELVCAAPDRLEWRDERRFMPAGRVDEAVQVGGVNVHPARIAAILKRHPGVRDAAVRLMRADEGRRLKAFVLPHAGADGAALKMALSQWVREQLAPAECPVSFTLGSQLPTNSQGKPADWIIDD